MPYSELAAKSGREQIEAASAPETTVQEDTAAVEEGGDARFDPRRYLVKINGRGDYLEVKWRLLWLRTAHPDAQLATEMVRSTDTYAVFKATVVIPGGGMATGWGSEEAGDFRDFLEKAECVNETTEILTDRGFRPHDALAVGDSVAAYDLASDALVWTPLRRVVVYEDAPVVRLAGKWFEAIVTANHSWATAAAYRSWVTGQSPRRLRKTSDLRSSDRIVLAAPAPGGDSDLTPDEAAILGWLFTDGTLWRADGAFSPRIYQSKAPQQARIRSLVAAFASERVQSGGMNVFPCGHERIVRDCSVWSLPARVVRPLLARADLASPADLPALIPKLSARARSAMLEAMMAADGDARGYFGKQRKPGVFEAWRILCTLEGLAVGPIRNGERFAVQRAKRRRYVSCSELTVTDAGRARVWCPTTDLGTWVARLPNGQITITGNTKSIGRALAALGFGTQFCQDHEFGAAQGWVVDSPADAPAGGYAGPSQMQQATERQVKFIRAIAREAGLDDAELEAWSNEVYGVGVGALNRRDASALIESLQRRRNEVPR